MNMTLNCDVTNSEHTSEVVGVTFSDSAPVPKFWNPGPDPALLQI